MKKKARPVFRVLESQPPIYLAKRPNGPIRKPEELLPMIREIVHGERRELFLAFFLNTRHAVTRAHIVSIGTLNTSLVHPREVFRPAIRYPSAAIILAHNHPSGSPQPSEDDLDITRRLAKVGEIMGIEVLDHLIVAGSKHFSLREAGLI